MTIVTLAGYLADAWVLTTYAILARTSRALAFHWANAIGCVPIILGELALRAYVPLVLTSVFGALGWVGVLRRQK